MGRVKTMKCPECNGTGKVVKYFYERIKANDYRKVCGDVTCEDCGGTGYIEQTNDEWLHTASTEELAREILTIYNRGYHAGYNDYDKALCVEDVIEWLKKKHGEWCNL